MKKKTTAKTAAKPTIGRIVHYVEGEKIEPGIITRVWSDTCVNVKVLPDDGLPTTKTSVVFGFSEATVPHWTWPPRS